MNMIAYPNTHKLKDFKNCLHYLVREARKSNMDDVALLIAAAEEAIDEAVARKHGLG
jgi:hypothetical protein